MSEPTVTTQESTQHLKGEEVWVHFTIDGKPRSAKALCTGKKFTWLNETYYLYIHVKSGYHNYLSIQALKDMQKQPDGVVEVVDFS